MTVPMKMRISPVSPLGCNVNWTFLLLSFAFPWNVLGTFRIEYAKFILIMSPVRFIFLLLASFL